MIKKILLFSAMVLSAPAMAHVTANPNEGTAGSYFETAFRVSHGCEGSDTISVSVQLPPGMVSAKPQAKSGWTIDVKKSKLDKPVPAGHGKMADEQVESITWRGRLAADQYDTFGILMKLPQAPGETLWFPVTQTCESGSHEWLQIPAEGQAWHDLKSPAPFVKLNETPPSHHGH